MITVIVHHSHASVRSSLIQHRYHAEPVNGKIHFRRLTARYERQLDRPVLERLGAPFRPVTPVGSLDGRRVDLRGRGHRRQQRHQLDFQTRSRDPTRA
jgi:hypothetical protein